MMFRCISLSYSNRRQTSGLGYIALTSSLLSFLTFDISKLVSLSTIFETPIFGYFYLVESIFFSVLIPVLISYLIYFFL